MFVCMYKLFFNNGTYFCSCETKLTFYKRMQTIIEKRKIEKKTF